MFTATYKDKTIIYHASKACHEFNKNIILMKQLTASSSEILAYTLGSNLKHANLAGEETQKKICGQDLFINAKCNFNFLVASLTWASKTFHTMMQLLALTTVHI
jgi:hypothetical protein